MNIDIKKIRVKIDKVDIKLLRVIKERSVLVDRVLKFKKKKERDNRSKKNKLYLKKNKKKFIKSQYRPNDNNKYLERND